MRLAVVGTGHVGLSFAVLLAQRSEITAVDVMIAKVDAINARRLPKTQC